MENLILKELPRFSTFALIGFLSILKSKFGYDGLPRLGFNGTSVFIEELLVITFLLNFTATPGF